MLEFCASAVSHAPGLLLVLIGFIVIGWVSYLYRSCKKDSMAVDGSIYRPYCAYAFAVAGWIFTNAYFQSDLLLLFDKKVAIYIAILANLFCFVALLCAYLFSCKLVSELPEKKLGRNQVIICIALALYAVFINLAPGMTVADVEIHDAGDFVIQFGDYNSLFFLSAPLFIALTFSNFFKAWKNKKRLSKLKFGYMVAGVAIFMISTLTALVAIPHFFNDFSLVWVPPTLSAIEALLIGYALLNNRFYSARYISVVGLTFLFNAMIYLVPMIAIASSGSSVVVIASLAVWTLISGIFWQRSLTTIRQLVNKVLYRKQGNPVDNICSLIGEFRYSSEQAIVKLNHVLNATHSRIQRADDSSHHIFLNYFNHDRRALIKEELEYVLQHHNMEDSTHIQALNDAMHCADTSLILPIADPSGDGAITHFYMVSKDEEKESLFSSEEILGLQSLFDEANKWIVTEDKVRKTQVLAGSIAHEIRNPFSKLRYHFERIDADMFGSNTSDEQFASEGMRKLYQELTESKKAVLLGTRFIDAILAEINGNGFDPEEFSYYSAKELTCLALNDFSFLNDEDKRRVRKHLDEDFVFFGSETLFSFVIYNLLKNAADYFETHNESVIDIRLLRSENENKLVISDTGPGISQEHQSKIFEDFFTHGKKNGTGLGLAYCKRVMDAFGGKIACRSEVGAFTEFTLTFPVVDEQCHERTLRQLIAGHIDKKQAMVIGNEQVSARISEYLVSDFNVALNVGSNAEIAISNGEGKALDFVIVAGFDVEQSRAVANLLRLNTGTRNLPIFYCSSETIPKDAAMKAGGLFQGELAAQNKIGFWQSIAKNVEAGAFNRLGTLNGKRILVVDDMQVNRLLVQAYLKSEGVEVIQAASGLEAIEQVKQNAFDLILMDINMPNMDGIQATKEIRKVCSQVPVVSLTGEYSPDIISEIEKVTDDHLEKPITKEQLVNMATKWCSHPRQNIKDVA